MPVSEEVGICRGGVDVEMVLESSIRVSGPRVAAPVDILAFQLGCLGAWDVQNSDLETVRVAVNA